MTENCKLRKAIVIRILQHFATKLWNITNFVMLFHAIMEFCLDLLRSKFWLIGEWSIGALKLGKRYFNTLIGRSIWYVSGMGR
jgi:hypothetical protein